MSTSRHKTAPHLCSSHQYSIVVTYCAVLFVACGRCGYTPIYVIIDTRQFYSYTGASCFDVARCDGYIFPLNRHCYTNHDDDIFEWGPGCAWLELLFCSNSCSGLTGLPVIHSDINFCFSFLCHPHLCSCIVTDKVPIIFHKRRRISFQEVTNI